MISIVTMIFKGTVILLLREGAINLEQLLPLAESIFENWNPDSFDKSLLVPVGASVEHESFYKY